MECTWLAWVGIVALGGLALWVCKVIYKKFLEVKTWIEGVHYALKDNGMLVRRVPLPQDSGCSTMDGRWSESFLESINKIEKRLDALETKPKKEVK